MIPPDEIEAMTDNIGLPVSGISLIHNNTGVIGSQDGDFQIKLREGHQPTATTCAGYARCCSATMPASAAGSAATMPARTPA